MKKHDVAVIGTIFVDVKGFSHQAYHPQGRNIGNVAFFHGGVGRNIAETMAQLDVQTAFVSTADLTGLSTEVLQRLEHHQVDTTYTIQTENGMGMYMAILDDKGDLAGSISQMPSLDEMEGALLKQVDDIVQKSKAIALEIDLNEKIAETYVQKAVQHQTPIYGIPGNLDVLYKRMDLLEHIQCFILNEIETEKLSGIVPDTMEDAKTAAEFFIQKGLKQVVITLGERGCYFYDALTGEHGPLSPQRVEVVDATGAGDSFFAGTVSALVKGETLAEAVKLGTRVAGVTISIPESTCQDLQERLRG
ncbi:carbohydrate kinase family protein [Caldalkalibacillus salinus]|uniref:carbohydrate kinase family protein n=1 Tax=Caldalkalibacillus salinus TaxID=2803787 RepID=UPI0019232E8A|nr:carbohydrate kinase family protein [Caldalkalibacillus salinus]